MPDDVHKTIFIFDQNGLPATLGESMRLLIASPVFVNIKDNGAIGDGHTDDTATIQRTIDTAPSGATIYFPPGTYLISHALQLKNGQNYVGSGATYNGSVIKQADNANVVALLAADEYITNATYSGSPLRIAYLYFDGNSAHNTAPPTNGGHGAVLLSSNCVVEQCWFHNIPQTAILFSDRNMAGTTITNTSIENRILSCKVDTTGQYGIWIRDQDNGRCTDGYIRDCVINNTADTAIFVDRSAGWFLSGNHVYACKKSGIVVNHGWSTSIIGNEVDGYGYDMTNSQQYYAGLSVTCIGPRATIVEGNIISTPETNPQTIYQHLVISGAASTDARCIVTSNDIMGGYVNTTSSTAISSPGSQTIQVASTTNIVVGQSLTIDEGHANQETVTVTGMVQAQTAHGNTITAVFTKTHNGTYPVTSGTPRGNSLGILIQSTETQTKAGQPFSVQLALNRIDGVGRDYINDGQATTILAPCRTIGDLHTDGSLTVGKHIVGSGPGSHAVTGANNGSSAPAPTLSGNDTRGTISFGCGNNAAAGTQVEVNYATPYDYTPTVVISPANAATAQAGNIWYVSNSTARGFSIATTDVPAPIAQPAHTYSFNYQVIG